jgi:chondroitin AC lyase
VIGTESYIGQNLLGYFFPFGATNIMVDANEYNDIAPVWDWSRIPGITAENTPNIPSISPTTHIVSSSADFAGGVSNGIQGLAAYDFNYEGLAAKKAYFFLGDYMYCLGAGVSATKANPVLSNLNQTFAKGAVTYQEGTSTRTLGTSPVNSNAISWVYHNQVAYLFPKSQNVTLQAKEQVGSWNLVSSSMSTYPKKANIFSLWLNHGNAPLGANYEYVVIPTNDPTSFTNFLSAGMVSTVINTTGVQAVRDKVTGSYGVVFYTPGLSVTLDSGFTLSADTPCAVLIVKKGTWYKISVANPKSAAVTVKLTTNLKLAGSGSTRSATGSSISFALPGGNLAGSTITKNYTYTP